MKGILVSVIIPVFNSEKFLRKCLDSLCNQTYRNIEIICIDDGSSDQSLSILYEYAHTDERFQVLQCEHTGKGAAAARNKGLDIAKGKYLLILDSDDFFDQELVALTLEKAERENADIVLYDIYYYSNGNSTPAVRVLNRYCLPDKQVFSGADVPEYIFQLTIGSAWSGLYRRDFIEKYHLRFQSVYHADDLMFSLSALALADRITTINKCLLYYRKDNVSSQTKTKNCSPDSAFQALFALKQVLLEHHLYDIFEQSFINRAVSYLRWYLDTLKDYEAFVSLYNKYQSTYFNQLDLTGRLPEEFYAKNWYYWYQAVQNMDVQKYLFILQNGFLYPETKNSGYVYRSPQRFPYEKIKQGEKIVLYGAGGIGKSFYIQMLVKEYCDIILWVDKRFSELGKMISDPENIQKVDYDKILIAVENQIILNDIYQNLIKKGIDESRIVTIDGISKERMINIYLE